MFERNGMANPTGAGEAVARKIANSEIHTHNDWRKELQNLRWTIPNAREREREELFQLSRLESFFFSNFYPLECSVQLSASTAIVAKDVIERTERQTFK